MTTTTTDWPWADEWMADGFLPFTPKAEKRPFGYHATPPDKTTPPVVPCPNCDAPNERNYWQHNGLEGLRDIKYEDPDAARKAAEDPKKYWKELHNHPSKYEVARCRFCGAEVRIPGGYRHGDKDVVWYYKPAPIPDKPVLVIDTMLNAPALFAHQWVDGSIVTHPEDRPWVSPYMLVDLFRSDRPHLLVNAYTGNLRFITGYQVMPSTMPCPACDKEGRVNGRRCTICNGAGEIPVSLESGVPLAAAFWDCECETEFIHSASEQSCPRCGARRDDQPNSRADEVHAAISPF